MNNEQFLSLPKNRAVVETLSLQVLAEVEPDELDTAARFIGPLIDMATRDEVVVRDPAHQAGGFGSADLMTSVVVPIVASALGSLLMRLAGAGIEVLNQKTESQVKEELDKLIRPVVEKSAKEMIRRTRSPKAKRKSKPLTEAVIVEVRRHFQIQIIGQMNVAGDQVSASKTTHEAGGDQVVVSRGGDQANAKGGALNE